MNSLGTYLHIYCFFLFIIKICHSLRKYKNFKKFYFFFRDARKLKLTNESSFKASWCQRWKQESFLHCLVFFRKILNFHVMLLCTTGILSSPGRAFLGETTTIKLLFVYDLWKIFFYCYVVFTKKRTCYHLFWALHVNLWEKNFHVGI